MAQITLMAPAMRVEMLGKVSICMEIRTLELRMEIEIEKIN